MAESTLKKPGGRIRIKLEPRLEVPSTMQSLLITLGAVVAALFLGGIVIAAVGGNPFLSYVYIARASFGSVGVLSDTIVKATPIILTALACSIAFRMKLWNIGAEGQFIMGAWGASAIVLAPVLPPETSRWLFIPVMTLAGLAMGAAWGFIPGYLKAKFNVNEIISSLMLNYIAVSWVNFWIFGVWSEGGFQMSPKFPEAASLPKAGPRRQTLNDSPQPHSLLTFGLLNRNPSFRPSRTKSSSVPSMYGRLLGSTKTRTP